MLYYIQIISEYEKKTPPLMTRQLREFGGGGDLGPAPPKEKVCFFLTSSYFYFYFKEKKVAKIHFWLLKKTKQELQEVRKFPRGIFRK